MFDTRIIVSIDVVHGGQLSPSVAVMFIARSMQPCSHVWTPQLPQLLPSLAKLLVEELELGCLKTSQESEVKLALPTYEHVRLPRCASVIDTLLFDEVVTKVPNVSIPGKLRIFTHRCSEHTYLVQCLLRWRLAPAAVSEPARCLWSSIGVEQ